MNVSQNINTNFSEETLLAFLKNKCFSLDSITSTSERNSFIEKHYVKIFELSTNYDVPYQEFTTYLDNTLTLLSYDCVKVQLVNELTDLRDNKKQKKKLSIENDKPVLHNLLKLTERITGNSFHKVYNEQYVDKFYNVLLEYKTFFENLSDCSYHLHYSSLYYSFAESLYQLGGDKLLDDLTASIKKINKTNAHKLLDVLYSTSNTFCMPILTRILDKYPEFLFDKTIKAHFGEVPLIRILGGNVMNYSLEGLNTVSSVLKNNPEVFLHKEKEMSEFLEYTKKLFDNLNKFEIEKTLYEEATHSMVENLLKTQSINQQTIIDKLYDLSSSHEIFKKIMSKINYDSLNSTLSEHNKSQVRKKL